MKHPNRERGFATLAMVIAIILFFFVVLSALQSQTVMFARRHVAVKSYFDAENAIETFAQPLYRSYILGSEIAPDNAVLGKRYRPATDLHEYENAAKTKLQIFAPSNQKICAYRSLPNGKVDPICVKIPGDLVVKRIDKDNTIEVARVAKPLELWKTRAARGLDSAVAFVRHTANAMGLPEAQAQTPTDVSDPGKGPVAALSYSVARNFDPTFDKNYASHNCLNAAQYDCVKIRICMKLEQACSQEEDYIYQSYVFDRPPQSQLKN